MEINKPTQFSLIALMLFAANLAVAADLDSYEEEYQALVQLYRLGHAAFLYAPYPVARDALEELAVAQEDFVDFLQRLTPAPGDGSLSAAHISSMVGSWLENAAVDYYRLYLLEREYGNPSQAQYYLHRALSIMGGPKPEQYLKNRASMMYQPQVSRLESFCDAVFRRAESAMENPEPIRIYRPEPNYDVALSELEPRLPLAGRPPEFLDTGNYDEREQ